MTQLISMFLRDESGQDLVEYCLVLVAVALAVIAGNASLSADFAAWMTALNTRITALIG